MGIHIGDSPSTQEVVEQMRKMLAAPRFVSTRVQSRILRFIVTRNLRNKEISEPEMAEAVFGIYDPTTHKVRSNTSLLRTRMMDYYQNEGRDDLVRLELPPGQGYKLNLSYNETANAIRLYQKGLTHLADFSLASLQASETYFEEAWDSGPESGPLLVARCDTSLLLWIEDSVFGVGPETARDHHGHIHALASCLKYAEVPDAWYSDIVLGAYSLLSCDWFSAEFYFQGALSANRAGTETSLWYAMYLVWTRYFSEARDILEIQLKKHWLNQGVNLACAVLYYLMSDHEEALVCCLGAYRPNGQGCEACLLIHSLVLFELGDFSGAQRTLADLTGSFTGQDFYAMFVHDKRSERSFDGLTTAFYAFQGNQTMARTFFSGALERMAERYNKDRWRIFFNKGRRLRGPSALQMAIGYTALGEEARALVSLRRASRTREKIILNFMDHIPLFYPLWGHPRFGEIKAGLDFNYSHRSIDD